MHIEEFREYCLAKKGVTESFPFDENVLVFKVLHKMFALTSVSAIEFKIALKCDPERAIELRESYENITPAFHMNKKHWNTIIPDSRIAQSLVRELIDHSYELVVAKMTKKDKEILDNI